VVAWPSPIASRRSHSRRSDIDEPRRRALPQIGMHAALHDAEDPCPGRGAGRERRRASPLGPAQRPLDRASIAARSGREGHTRQTPS
jgi:hypothetical protein